MAAIQNWGDYFRAYARHVEALDGWVEAYAIAKGIGPVDPRFLAQLSQYLEAVNSEGQELYVLFTATKTTASVWGGYETRYANEEFRDLLMAQTGYTEDQILEVLTSYHSRVGQQLGMPVLAVLAIVAIAAAAVSYSVSEIVDAVKLSRKVDAADSLLTSLPVWAKGMKPEQIAAILQSTYGGLMSGGQGLWAKVESALGVILVVGLAAGAVYVGYQMFLAPRPRVPALEEG